MTSVLERLGTVDVRLQALETAVKTIDVDVKAVSTKASENGGKLSILIALVSVTMLGVLARIVYDVFGT